MLKINKDFKPVYESEEETGIFSDTFLAAYAAIMDERTRAIRNAGRRKPINIDLDKQFKIAANSFYGGFS